MRNILYAAAAFAGVTGAIAQPASDIGLASPDQRNRIDLSVADGKLRYTVSRDGRALLSPSPIGMVTSQGPLGGSDLEVVGTERASVDDIYRPVVGKAAQVPDRYEQVTLHLKRRADGVVFDLIARAYADGVAYRFVVPPQDRFKAIDVYWETTGFYFPADYDCWGANAGVHANSHEFEYDPVKASRMRSFHLYDAPLLCSTGKGGATFALAEADKRDYAGAYFRRRGDGGLGVNISLTTRTDNAQDGAGFKTAVRASLSDGPLVTPWRVMMLGDTPGDLIPSNLISLLAEPSKIADTSWIRPGKAAWDWWNGWAVDVPQPGVNTATYKAYIDFAQKMGLEYVLIDEGWYKGSSEAPTPADVTVPIPAVDLPGLVRYAQERGVSLWVWLQWKQLERQMDDALALYAAWGIKGIKVDFMDRNDQEMVAFYHRILSTAAKSRLMVDLHGAYPPDGLARTWPNYMTQEGVLGAEYNKFGTRITATHNVTLPFTRGLLGPMDYTPGGFHAVSPAEFAGEVRLKRPFVQTTRGQALAMYVVYDSPFVMLADSPDSYIGADGALTPGSDFLKDVPANWDETRFLSGAIGEHVVIARRKGATWYIGAMTNESGWKVRVPLDALGAGKRWRARLWQDGADMNSLRTGAVEARGSLALTLAPSGGAVAVLTPAD
ncbi:MULTISPECIES: glycoside hydrolase family 97 protein [unclassified Sphingobium]|uniref:glycoside hydrolase family 97 protein n=1 Tax=unclassified Sphingobium TaxID=2611147 RepID=UPI0035A665B8